MTDLSAEAHELQHPANLSAVGRDRHHAADIADLGESGLRGAFRSLQSPNYRIWAAGALVSNIGSWMQRTAQDWIVLTELTDHNATAVGIVMGLQFGPQILMLPLTGFVADHMDRRKVLFCTQGAMGLLALGLGLLVRQRAGAALARLYICVPARLCVGVRLAGAANFRGRTRRRALCRMRWGSTRRRSMPRG